MDAKEMMEACLMRGACVRASEMARGVRDWRDLSRLLFRSQSREWCMRECFPPLGMFRAAPAEVRDYGVYVDAGDVVSHKRDTALIGETRGRVEADDTVHIYRVVVMHGARAVVVARKGAVVHVALTADCAVETDADGSSRIYLE